MRFSIFGFLFDWPEFIFGILAGLATSWLIRNLKPTLIALPRFIQIQMSRINQRLSASAADPYRLDLIAHAERAHVAAPLLDLSTILIEPRVIYLPSQIDPTQGESPRLNTLPVFPIIPGWNPLAAIYNAPAIPITSLIGRDINFLITGEPGSGKSTALCYLIFHLIKLFTDDKEHAVPLPVLIHAADFDSGKDLKRNPFIPVLHAIQRTSSLTNAHRLESYIRAHVVQGQVLLLLDGIDEIPSAAIQPLTEWLQIFQKTYPGIQIIAAGSPSGHNGLTTFGLVPVPLAPWTKADRQAFLRNWGIAWQQKIAPRISRRLGDIDPTLINAWLDKSLEGYTSLELTLRTWSAYAGDLRGPGVINSIESYLARMLAADERRDAELIAFTWLSQSTGITCQESAPDKEMLGDLAKAGILRYRPRSGERLSFSQPAIGSFLAAKFMEKSTFPKEMLEPGTSIAETALRYFAALGDISPIVQHRLEQVDKPLHINELSCARWLHESSKNASWRSSVLSTLGSTIVNDNHPFGLRLRAVQAMVYANNPGTAVLFKRMLKQDSSYGRILAAFGLGGLHHSDSVPDLITTVQKDHNLLVRQACAIALSVIGTDTSFECLGRILLQGDDELQLAAAMALACDTDEGYQMLRDALDIQNPSVRRAAIFGLARVHTPWALEILENAKFNDDHLLVRNAALEVLEQMQKPILDFAPLAESLADLPWLIAFAAREGLGVAPGRGARETLRRSFNDGTSEEKLAALETVAWFGDEEFMPELSQALNSADPYTRDTAFETLWKLASKGIVLTSAIRSKA